MRALTRTHAFVFAISAALAVAGCSGDGDRKTAGGDGELFMQPVAAQGPDPFTDSTAKSDAAPPPVTRSPQPAPSGSATPQGTRSLSGGTPGLYGGTHAVGSCDVDRQVRFLTGDRTKERAFAQASGIDEASVPGFLRGLTPVVLRADTRVTNHGFRGGSATSFQSVLQAGTAVLVDDRGLPRVRCACGNPLKPPVALKGTPRHNGQPWRDYRPTTVVVVTPAPRPITNITIINIVNNTWIERKIGDGDADQDRRTKPPVPPPPPKPSPSTPTPSTPTPTTRTPSTSTPPTSVSPTDPVDPDISEPDGTDSGDTPRTPTSPDQDPGASSSGCPSGTPTDPASPLPPGCPPPSTDLPSSPDLTTQEQEPDSTVPDDPNLSENPLSDSDPGSFDS
ncbi:DUF6777 domain-containing protein [Streptomyces sp. NPDC002564]|uniref:DUF6777 domain-containing protein n=1 Tax=Streptomyces sp. NPDC002564 TaxID=3364649 RepID=UPI003687F4FE